MTHAVYIGVGSNMGDARMNCLRGMGKVIRHPDAAFVAVSSLYRTSPVSPVVQDDFLNCVLGIAWRSGPSELLSFLQDVEEDLGRTREVRFGPRTLDLDILLFDDLVLDGPALTIPPPRLHERRFALVPCLEIDPGLVHPRLGKPLSQCLGEIGPGQEIAPVERLSRLHLEAVGG
jgi:2-amino-4-hydroxy-6-hydroxymethyldihydropteridine diphosphokinase